MMENVALLSMRDTIYYSMGRFVICVLLYYYLCVVIVLFVINFMYSSSHYYIDARIAYLYLIFSHVHTLIFA